MSRLSSATVLSLVDSMANILSQAYQLARARLASAASPIGRLPGESSHRWRRQQPSGYQSREQRSGLRGWKDRLVCEYNHRQVLRQRRQGQVS